MSSSSGSVVMVVARDRRLRNTRRLWQTRSWTVPAVVVTTLAAGYGPGRRNSLLDQLPGYCYVS